MTICRVIPNLVNMGQTFLALDVNNLSVFHFCWWHKFAVKAVFLNAQYLYFVDSGM